MDALDSRVAPEFDPGLAGFGEEVEVLSVEKPYLLLPVFPDPISREPLRPKRPDLWREFDEKAVAAGEVNLEELPVLPVHVGTTLNPPPDVGLCRPLLGPIHARDHLNGRVVPGTLQQLYERIRWRQGVVTDEEDVVAVVPNGVGH